MLVYRLCAVNKDFQRSLPNVINSARINYNKYSLEVKPRALITNLHKSMQKINISDVTHSINKIVEYQNEMSKIYKDILTPSMQRLIRRYNAATNVVNQADDIDNTQPILSKIKRKINRKVRSYDTYNQEYTELLQNYEKLISHQHDYINELVWPAAQEESVFAQIKHVIDDKGAKCDWRPISSKIEICTHELIAMITDYTIYKNKLDTAESTWKMQLDTIENATEINPITYTDNTETIQLDEEILFSDDSWVSIDSESENECISIGLSDD